MYFLFVLFHLECLIVIAHQYSYFLKKLYLFLISFSPITATKGIFSLSAYLNFAFNFYLPYRFQY